RGKILNVASATSAKIIANQEIADLTLALGCGTRKDCEPDNLRYERVIIMTDADVDGAHIRTLLLTFFYRQMPELIRRGHVYVAQPPLYQVTRRKRVEYVDDDVQLNRILIDLGTDDLRLRQADGTEFTAEQLREILGLLERLDKFRIAMRRHGGDLERYLEQRDAATGRLPGFLVVVREGNHDSAHYFIDEEQVREFGTANPDLMLFDREVTQAAAPGNGAGGTRRRARLVELFESNALQKLIDELSARGLGLDRYSGQEQPIFELVEGGGDKVHAIHSIPDILTKVVEIGRRGVQIKRFKGLGEMNAKELFETTMNPARRKMLRVELNEQNAIEADKMFTILMGDAVEPRRQFIEDNALNVRNLDV
ncbi:MAG: DNA gyrase subunit B, partial [Verrucomicrobia bacterium]|nr:DNA gyrase subunit B [Verrucomicrobiota bacterium]